MRDQVPQRGENLFRGARLLQERTAGMARGYRGPLTHGDEHGWDAAIVEAIGQGKVVLTSLARSATELTILTRL